MPKKPKNKSQEKQKALPSEAKAAPKEKAPPHDNVLSKEQVLEHETEVKPKWGKDVSAIGDGDCAFNTFAMHIAEFVDYYLWLAYQGDEKVIERAPGLMDLFHKWNERYSDCQFATLADFLENIKKEKESNKSGACSRTIQRWLAPLLRKISAEFTRDYEREGLEIYKPINDTLNNVVQKILELDGELEREFTKLRQFDISNQITYAKQKLVFNAFQEKFESYLDEDSDDIQIDDDKCKTLEDKFLAAVMMLENKTRKDPKRFSDNGVYEFRVELLQAFEESIKLSNAEPLLTALKKVEAKKSGRLPADYDVLLTRAKTMLVGEKSSLSSLFENTTALLKLDLSKLELGSQEEIEATFSDADQKVDDKIQEAFDSDATMFHQLVENIFEQRGKHIDDEGWNRACLGQSVESMEDWSSLSSERKVIWFKLLQKSFEGLWGAAVFGAWESKVENPSKKELFYDPAYELRPIYDGLDNQFKDVKKNVRQQAQGKVKEYIRVLSQDEAQDNLKRNTIYRLLERNKDFRKDVMKGMEDEIKKLVMQDDFNFAANRIHAFPAIFKEFESKREDQTEFEEFIAAGECDEIFQEFERQVGYKFAQFRQDEAMLAEACKEKARILEQILIGDFSDAPEDEDERKACLKVIQDALSHAYGEYLLDEQVRNYQRKGAAGVILNRNRAPILFDAHDKVLAWWADKGMKAYAENMSRPAGNDEKIPSTWGGDADLRHLASLFDATCEFMPNTKEKFEAEDGRELIMVFRNDGSKVGRHFHGVHYHGMFRTDEAYKTRLRYYEQQAALAKKDMYESLPESTDSDEVMAQTLQAAEDAEQVIEKSGGKKLSPPPIYSPINDDEPDYTWRFLVSVLAGLVLGAVALAIFLAAPVTILPLAAALGVIAVGALCFSAYNFVKFLREGDESSADQYLAERPRASQDNNVDIEEKNTASNQKGAGKNIFSLFTRRSQSSDESKPADDKTKSAAAAEKRRQQAETRGKSGHHP